MERAFYKITLVIDGVEKPFVQSHPHWPAAVLAGQRIIDREYGGQGQIKEVRQLSGLETRVLLAGWNPVGMSNQEMQERMEKCLNV